MDNRDFKIHLGGRDPSLSLRRLKEVVKETTNSATSSLAKHLPAPKCSIQVPTSSSQIGQLKTSNVSDMKLTFSSDPHI